MQGRPIRNALLAALLALTFSACSSLDFQRTSPRAGTFTASALTFTFLSFDFPGDAAVVARGNVSDARQPNTVITNETVLPYLGWFDWLLDIIGLRYARLEGTWGFEDVE